MKNRNLRIVAGLTILLPVLVLYAYSLWPGTFRAGGLDFKKYSFFLGGDEYADSNSIDSSLVLKVDTNLLRRVGPLDTSAHRIMLIGDSESGGLRSHVNDYCLANGHELVYSLEWYSSTIFNFARADTVQGLIKRYQPTYIMFVVGLNELYATDLEARKEAAFQLKAKFGELPFTWIGPANWTEDKGLNLVFEEVAGDAFFESRKLDLPRGADGRHPSLMGYQIWMDSLGSWMNNHAQYSIRMKAPEKRGLPVRGACAAINAVKFRGY